MKDTDSYERYCTCNKCGGLNHIDVTDSLDHHMCEAELKCKECGFDDYWAYGHLESTSTIGRIKCKTY